MEILTGYAVTTMEILIVYGTQFGNTEHLARSMGSALAPRHRVRVVSTREALTMTGHGVDLLLVGAPTQMFGRRLLVREFLDGLETHGFTGLPAAAFDTRMGTPTEKNASAAEVIAERLEAAGCRVVASPGSFLVAGFNGPIVEGEEERARDWALGVVEPLAATAR